MKQLLIGLWALALAGCQATDLEELPSLDDQKVLSEVLAKAVDRDKLEPKRLDGYLVLCVPGSEDAYSGWVKETDEKGNLKSLGKLKSGKKQGRWTSWHENREKKSEIQYVGDVMGGDFFEWHANGQVKARGQTKDGEMDGHWVGWYENGTKAGVQWCNVGHLVSALSWKPDGSKCPETNATKGNGVFVEYNEDGSIDKRQIFKDGVGTEAKD